MERRHLKHGRGQPLGPVGIQNLSPMGTEDTPGDKDTGLQNFGWYPLADHPPFRSQKGPYDGIADAKAPQVECSPEEKALSPTLESYELSQPPGVLFSMAPGPASSSFDQYVFGAPGSFSNCQIHMNGLESYQPPHQEANSSSFTWGSTVQLDQPNATSNLWHSDAPLRESSGQQREDTLVPKDVQEDQEPGSALSSKDDSKDFWEQYCCDDCDKQYRRPQELKRHTRDKHEQQGQCPFCYATWSRPEKIRAHLITEHGDRLSEDEAQKLHSLRGRRRTINFITKCGTATPPT